jgi:hypothetical protein
LEILLAGLAPTETMSSGAEESMSRQAYIQLVVATALCLLPGCDYGLKQYRQADDILTLGTTPLVIEIDDYGRFWNPTAAEATLNVIANASRNKNTLVMAFIHGWHHNADDCDENFKNFHSSLEGLQERLDEPPYRDARKRLNLKDDIQVIGLYIGWRGRSLPSVLDYTTFGLGNLRLNELVMAI